MIGCPRLDRWRVPVNIRPMSKRVKHATVEGPKGEVVKVSWMPDKRVRFDFENCGKCAVTKIFPKDKTHVEVKYGLD